MTITNCETVLHTYDLCIGCFQQRILIQIKSLDHILVNVFFFSGVYASFYPPDCFTWQNNKQGQLVLSCKLSGARTNVRIYDSKKRYNVNCPNDNETIKCKYKLNEKNETIFTVTVENKYEDQWFCEHEDKTLHANISTSEGKISIKLMFNVNLYC